MPKLLDYIMPAYNALKAVDPSLPRALFVALVFLTVLAWRKLSPGSWLKFSSVIPVSDEDTSWFMATLLKVWQALPSALLGAIYGALGTGGNVVESLKLAALALLAPVIHELAWRYEGKLGTKKTPGGPSGARLAEPFDDTTPPSLPGARPRVELCVGRSGGIQKVEIVVTSNQDPGKIARAVVAHIAKVARPTVSALAILMLCAGCSLFSKVDWPKVVQCGGDLAQAELSAVQRILAGNGDTTAELESLAKSYAPSTIECAVQQVISDLQGHGYAMSRADVAAVQRGREFLAKVQK